MTVDPKRLAIDLGGFWYRSYGVAPCPLCQVERRNHQNALTINSDGERLLLHCKRLGCDFRDILSAAGIAPGEHKIDQMALANAAAERAEQAAKAKARARSIWERARPISGTHGEAYFRGRGITCDIPDTLRWSSDLYHGPSSQYLSAIVADVEPTGGVHRTFFTKKGQRLDQSAKMMLGPCAGGVVRLSSGQGPIVVTEGIEDGLALMSGVLDSPSSVWASLSSSGMAGLILAAEPHELVVANDVDETGRAAAHKLAERASALGWSVSLLPPPDGFKDWAETLEKRTASTTQPPQPTQPDADDVLSVKSVKSVVSEGVCT
ncbi:MAG: toprim domain-containing protein [Pseudomonadota bacterium]